MRKISVFILTIMLVVVLCEDVSATSGHRHLGGCYEYIDGEEVLVCQIPPIPEPEVIITVEEVTGVPEKINEVNYISFEDVQERENAETVKFLIVCGAGLCLAMMLIVASKVWDFIRGGKK